MLPCMTAVAHESNAPYAPGLYVLGFLLAMHYMLLALYARGALPGMLYMLSSRSNLVYAQPHALDALDVRTWSVCALNLAVHN
jgi:hypothetical protein